MHPAAGLLLSYLLGSIPAAYIAGKLKGVDLRQHGSGNLGATNVFRVLGWKIGLLVFVAVAFGIIALPLLAPRSGAGSPSFHPKPVWNAGPGSV